MVWFEFLKKKYFYSPEFLLSTIEHIFERVRPHVTLSNPPCRKVFSNLHFNGLIHETNQYYVKTQYEILYWIKEKENGSNGGHYIQLHILVTMISSNRSCQFVHDSILQSSSLTILCRSLNPSFRNTRRIPKKAWAPFWRDSIINPIHLG